MAAMAGKSPAMAGRISSASRMPPENLPLHQVDAVTDLARVRDAERIGLPVQIQAGHLGQPDAGVQAVGIGLAGEDLDIVAELGQAAGQMPHVDTLATAMSLAAIGQ